MLYDTNDKVTFGMDYMSGAWNANGYETDIFVPTDGKPHAWALEYDPDATPPTEWPDPRMKAYLSSQRQTIEQVVAKARESEPGVTKEEIENRVHDALAAGLVSCFVRSKGTFYTLNESYEGIRGKITFRFDAHLAYVGWLTAAHAEAPTVMDRFGLFNLQVYHRKTEFYISDLIVNGEPIDLSKDPGWEGQGNEVTFRERDFQRQNFGFSETNWAGEKPGEVGGETYRAEPNDPTYGYYGVETGNLTLDDPISFRGSICFTEGGTDAAIYFGYFNAAQQKRTMEPTDRAFLSEALGVVVDGPTRIGYYFMPTVAPKSGDARRVEGPIFLPTRDRHRFSVNYDPSANSGVGRLTATLDDKTMTLDLTPELRKSGITLDRFGIATVRTGGKYVVMYLDDLEYTARADSANRPHHEQQLTVVPYPRGGRQF